MVMSFPDFSTGRGKRLVRNRLKTKPIIWSFPDNFYLKTASTVWSLQKGLY